MIEELKKFENLGTPNYFWELFQQLDKGDFWTEKDVKSHFFNKIVDDKAIFDGCLPLLKLSKIISINETTNELYVDFAYKNLRSQQWCKQKLLKGFLLAFCEDEIFYNFFSSEHSSYDIVYKLIQINHSAFGLKYANIRRLLIDFDFLKPHPDFPQKKLIINSSWKKFFDEHFVPKIRKRKIGIEELKRKLEQQQISGDKAEEFVLAFESKRLNQKQGIERIANYYSNAGYDILSFNKLNSKENDRFIEVKSFVGTPNFYWTQNEMKTAKSKAENYFLYLVDREKSGSLEYKPIMISNPIQTVINNTHWIKRVNKYHIVEDK